MDTNGSVFQEAARLAEAPRPGKLFVESDFEAALLQNFEDEGLSMKAGGNVDLAETRSRFRESREKRFIHSTARSHSGSEW